MIRSFSPQSVTIGMDVGTSGCRAMAIDQGGHIVARAERSFPKAEGADGESEQDPMMWWNAARIVICALTSMLPPQSCRALSVDGTSGTVLLSNAFGEPLSVALLYNDARAQDEADRIAAVAPATTAAFGVGSSLAKALWLLRHHTGPTPRWIVHPADWVLGRFAGYYGFTDSNSALKTGFDPILQAWPAWLADVGMPSHLLPAVLSPGTDLGLVAPSVAATLGLAPDCRIISGTTDSTAAVIATGALDPGEAVTSLGSTLVTKVIATKPIFAPQFGIYSQPFGHHWLVGGGSNSGGAVLRAFFSDEQMAAFSSRLDSSRDTGLDYYPLLRPGERFPVYDPDFAPRLMPRPRDDGEFFQALLEGIANIERTAYQRLAELGAPYPSHVVTVGGGSGNAAWQRIRERRLGVPVRVATQQDACYGAAQLAWAGLTGVKPSYVPRA